VATLRPKVRVTITEVRIEPSTDDMNASGGS